jgi:nitrate/nitrite-specific signal transduction histidine kinase
MDITERKRLEQEILAAVSEEAVTNAVKHGEDKRSLTITGDGLGLTETFLKNNGTGLQIMRYRAATIGASLEIGRAGKRGVCVSCSSSKQRELKGP